MMLSEMFLCIARFNFDCSSISDDVNLYQIYRVDTYFMIILLYHLLFCHNKTASDIIIKHIYVVNLCFYYITCCFVMTLVYFDRNLTRPSLYVSMVARQRFTSTRQLLWQRRDHRSCKLLCSPVVVVKMMRLLCC